MRVPPKIGLKAVFAGLLFVFSVQVLLASCETNVVFHTKQVKWDQLYVISTVPEANVVTGVVDGVPTFELEPMCSTITDDPDGLQFSVLFQGSIKKGSDKDQSIKPGDFLDNTEVLADRVTSSRFEFSLDCLEPYPDDNLFECSGEDAIKGGVMEEFSVDFHRYDEEDANNESDIAVAILIDMSGSMIGLVDPIDKREDDADSVAAKLAGLPSFIQNATDPGSVRYAAIESVIDTLNTGDSLVVVAFKENSIKVICKSPTGEEEAEQLWKECFGTNRQYVVGPLDPDVPDSQSVLDSFRGDEEGRTPLWSALNWTYDMMRDQSDKSQSADLRHILVITDGPDTCGDSTDLNQCSNTCLQTADGYGSFLTKLDQDPDQVIPVHFVQMEAQGYPERDPRQMEVACLTGGHYAFINTSVITTENLLEVMRQTLRRIRFTFRGYWRFHVALGSVKKANKPKVGYVYGVAGGGKVLPLDDQMLVAQEDIFSFASGTASGGTNVDRRVAFRKECDPADHECPADSKEDSCTTRTWWCDEQTLTCKSTLEWQENGTETGCGKQTATINLTIQYPKENKIADEYDLVELKGVPTVCCKGRCQPPRAPDLPDDIKQPDGVLQACVYYTSDWRWLQWEDENEQAKEGWVITATVKDKTDCKPVSEVIAAFKAGNLGESTYPEDWDCGGDNCYPPPGAEE